LIAGNSDVDQHTDTAPNTFEPLYSAEDTQNNLVNALNKLRNRELDGLFLDRPQEQQQVTQPYFGFSISGEDFVVSARHFCEVFTDIAIAPLPNAPSVLLGLVNLRGLLLPVYQLQVFLSAASPADQGQKTSRKKIVLVIGKGERAVGLLIDALPVSLSLSLPPVVEPVPHPRLSGLAQVHLLPDRALAQLAIEQLPERLLAMASEFSP